jgi:hypothetical protein
MHEKQEEKWHRTHKENTLFPIWITYLYLLLLILCTEETQ